MPALEAAYGIPTRRRYFVTDCWIGSGGHLHRYEVTGPDGHVGIFKTLGEAVYAADSLDAADTREEN